jgi:Spx/MgsR family transcriptional regulator
MIIYLYSKCSTCQKALHFLLQNNIDVKVKDISKEPPSLKELQQMLNFQEGNIKKLLNTSGQLYRDMNLSEKLKEMSQDDLLSILSQNGMLIKRPFLLAKTFGTTGFNETEWSKLLGF